MSLGGLIETATQPSDMDASHARGHRCQRVRARKKALAAAAREASDAGQASEAQWAATAARHQLKRERERVKALMRQPWSDAGLAGLRVVCDLGMQGLMCEAELASLAQQLTLGYGLVLRGCSAQPDMRPLRLAFVGADGESAVLRKLDRTCDAAKWPVRRSAADFAEAAAELCRSGCDGDEEAEVGPPDPQLVVLSPDAQEPLAELDPTAVYIVGGLCDYRRVRNATRGRAEARGVVCRRLPLREALGRTLAVEILTVDQVLHVLLEAANNGSDWARALEAALPPRKLQAAAPTGAQATTAQAAGPAEARPLGDASVGLANASTSPGKVST